MLKAKQVFLRLLEEQDLPLRVKWVNDPEIRTMLMFDYPLSLAKTRKWFFDSLFDQTKVHFSIITNDTNIVIGMTGFLQINRVHQNAQFYVTIGEKTYWGRRIADEVITMMMFYGFKELNLHKIYLYTLENNAKARKTYERNGFRSEGILRQHYYCVGKFQNIHHHSILRDEWIYRKQGMNE